MNTPGGTFGILSNKRLGCQDPGPGACAPGSQGLGARGLRAWAPAHQALGALTHKNFLKTSGESKRSPPTLPHPQRFGAVREKGRGFWETPPKVGGFSPVALIRPKKNNTFQRVLGANPVVGLMLKLAERPGEI